MAAVAQPAQRLWTRDEYYRLGDLGVFDAEQRLELLDGVMVRKVSPQASRHASVTADIADVLRQISGPEFQVREEKPLDLGVYNPPEPDAAVVRKRRRGYRRNHPTVADVLLAVEVSDSSLPQNRGRKARIYAASGIPEYWTVNLTDMQIEVLTDPGSAPDGAVAYRTVNVLRGNDTISPRYAAASGFRVNDVMGDGGER